MYIFLIHKLSDHFHFGKYCRCESGGTPSGGNEGGGGDGAPNLK